MTVVLAATVAASAVRAPEASAQDASGQDASGLGVTRRSGQARLRGTATSDFEQLNRPTASQGSETSSYITPEQSIAPSQVNAAASQDADGTDTDAQAEAKNEDETKSEGEAQENEGVRRRTADGELAEPPIAAATNDGLLAEPEPTPLLDGADPTLDTRPPEDLAVFDEPPAGHDALLFQVEDIDPVLTDRRPERLAQLDPYDPIGIKVGSFVLFPEAEIGSFATNNVFAAADKQSDVAATLSTSTRLVSNWSVHALELRGTTASSYYSDFSSEDQRAWSAEARGRLDISRRGNLQAIASHAVSQESRTGVNANRTGTPADISTDTVSLAYNQRFNRLTLQLRGSLSNSDYSDTPATNNDERDQTDGNEAVRLRWEFKPTFAAFAEAGLNQHRTGAVAASDGISRESKGERYRAGLDFGGTSRILRGEISLGYGRQTPDDARLRTTNAFLFDANLAWRMTDLTSLFLTAATDISDTTTALASGAVTHQVGIEARHALRRYVIASAGLSYTDYDYITSPTHESALLASLGAEYYASPEVVLFGRYQHLDYSSNQSGGDYTSDDVRVGVRLRR
ncbi:MAG: outer membrane beta-barrel protein [Hyphomicrobium sp.]